MFNKTTSFIFNKYGEIVNDLTRRQSIKMTHSVLKLKDKEFTSYYTYNSDVYVKVLSGIVMLVVSKDEKAKEFERFVTTALLK